MNLTKLTDWWQGLNFWERVAVAVWTAMLIAISLRVLIAPHSQTVYPIFAESARQWWTGGAMYPPHRSTELPGGFRYSPAFAVLTSPFALLPDAVGGVLWRLFMTGILLGTLAWWIRTVVPRPLTRTQAALLWILIAPLSVASINNGQANVLIIATMLAAVAGAREQRWNLVAVCMGLAFLLKVYPLAIGLLLVIVYPRQLAARLTLALVVCAGFPFLCQKPEYVARQYHDWIECVRVDDRSQVPLSWAYRDAWLLIRRFDLPISRAVYVVVQGLAAAGVAGLCMAMKRRGWPERQLLTALVGLGACWMMLFGPATESSTYVLLAPMLAWAVLESWLLPRSWAVRGMLLAGCALLLSSRVASWFPEATEWHALGVHPLGTILLLISLLLAQLRRPVDSVREQEAPSELRYAQAA